VWHSRRASGRTGLLSGEPRTLTRETHTLPSPRGHPCHRFFRTHGRSTNDQHSSKVDSSVSGPSLPHMTAEAIVWDAIVANECWDSATSPQRSTWTKRKLPSLGAGVGPAKQRTFTWRSAALSNCRSRVAVAGGKALQVKRTASDGFASGLMQPTADCSRRDRGASECAAMRSALPAG
jgi:hypothetical protein